ncbi:MAG: hypothetical protein ACXVF8_15125 [Blastococcus sp.]
MPALLVLASACSASTLPPPTPTSSVQTPTASTQFLSVALNTHDPVTADLGFTAVDVTPSQVQQLPENRKGLVWLGGYDRKTCTLLTSDAELRQQFATYRLAGDPRVLGYFVADEPNTDHNCPQSVEQVRARSALVHSLDPDPRRFTLVNVDDPAEFAAFKSTVDVLATDPYPCRVGGPCNSHLIPDRIASLRRAGVTHYVAIVQAFAGAPWRWPTARELQQMLDQWRRSDWCGVLVFSWTWDGANLSDHPELLAVLKAFNAHPPRPSRACS